MASVRELTPRGPGGVSVLELRGEDALARVRALAPAARAALVPGAPPRPVLVRLVAQADGGEELDEALVCVRDAQTVELHVHGSPPLVRRLMRELGGTRELGGEPPPGPPRSVEELARERLASAPCEAAARILLDQAEGALRRDVLAACARPAAERRALFDELIERGRVARACLVPLEVVLAGPVNAGKSTLFNALVGEERVVVSGEAGTTRDRVREPALLGPWPIQLSDTAGERPLSGAGGAQESVEREGQQRARGAREQADLVLWLTPAGEAPAGEAPAGDAPEGEARGAAPQASGRSRLARLVTQVDRGAPGVVGAADAGLPGLSALRDPEGAREVVLGVFRAVFDLPDEPWGPGRGVPFEDEHLARLRAWAELDGPDAMGGAEPDAVEAARRWLDGLELGATSPRESGPRR